MRGQYEAMADLEVLGGVGRQVEGRPHVGVGGGEGEVVGGLGPPPEQAGVGRGRDVDLWGQSA